MLRCHTRMPEPTREAPFEPVRDKRICIPRPGNNLPVPGLSRNYPCGSTHQCLRDFRQCQLPLTAGTRGQRQALPVVEEPNLQSGFTRRCLYPNASWASSGDGSGSHCPLVCGDVRLPASTSTETATTAGSIRITAYPATAPAPKPGAKIRASGMLADDALPTVSTLK